MKKKNNSIKNILIKDNSDSGSQFIILKKGIILDDSLNKYLELENGIIINNINKKDLKFFGFENTLFSLNKFKTKTTVTPKIQETSSEKIIKCLKNLRNNNFVSNFNEGEFNCQKSLKNKLIEELYKRVFSPVFILTLGIISCFLIIKSSNNFNYKYYKAKVFFTGISIIIIAQILNNFATKNFYSFIFSTCFPVALIIVTYFIFYKKVN